MTIKKLKVQSNYSALFENILLLQHDNLRKHKKSPTIAEISAIIGDTEEHILESIEFGKPDSSKVIH